MYRRGGDQRNMPLLKETTSKQADSPERRKAKSELLKKPRKKRANELCGTVYMKTKDEADSYNLIEEEK